MMTLHFCGEVPFHQVYVHGLVRDGEGQKMSKSKGNVIDPIDLIDGIELDALVAKRTAGMMQPQMAAKVEKTTRKHFPDGIPGYGTDALRFTFYSLASTGRDIKFDVGRMEGYRNFCNKLWNAARYVLMNTETYKPNVADREYSVADRWIQSRLQKVIRDTYPAQSKTTVLISRHSLSMNLCGMNIVIGTWNSQKPILWDDGARESQLNGTRATLLNVLESILRLLHPLMPFITEEIWQSISDKLEIPGKTIMLEPWPEIGPCIDR